MRIFLSFLGTLLLLVLVWLVLPQSVKLKIEEATSIQAYLHNSKGVLAFEGGDSSQALSEWSEGLSSNPSEDRLHFNLGVGFQTLKKGDEATSSYDMVLKSPNGSDFEKFAAEYNMGTMAQANKDVDGALKHYQAALDFNPESKETKINIELLISQGGGGGKDKDKNGEGKEKSDDPGDGKDKQDDKPKEYAPNKPQKPQFKSEDLTPSDVNKILGEIKQQEQRIRAEYSRKEAKESKNDKDW